MQNLSDCNIHAEETADELLNDYFVLQDELKEALETADNFLNETILLQRNLSDCNKKKKEYKHQLSTIKLNTIKLNKTTPEETVNTVKVEEKKPKSPDKKKPKSPDKKKPAKNDLQVDEIYKPLQNSDEYNAVVSNLMNDLSASRSRSRGKSKSRGGRASIRHGASTRKR